LGPIPKIPHYVYGNIPKSKALPSILEEAMWQNITKQIFKKSTLGLEVQLWC
jgi:hypothetical protein